MNKKIKVCAYCRVSTDNKDQENSLANQQNYFEREINKNGQYSFIDIYADKGVSGTRLNRPEFDRMLKDAGLNINDNYKPIKQSKFDLIMVKNTSRFARNVSVDVILKALRQNNVYVYFLDLDKTTEKDEDMTYIQIFQTFDERESRDKSKKVKFGLMESAKQGKIAPVDNLFGYTYIAGENRLEINEKEAEVVKLIFNLYANNMGTRRIRRYLKEKEIYTRNNKEFSEVGLQYIVLNECYIGVSVRNKVTRNNLFGEAVKEFIEIKASGLYLKQKEYQLL